jgi:hypothetical protein
MVSMVTVKIISHFMRCYAFNVMVVQTYLRDSPQWGRGNVAVAMQNGVFHL